MRSHGLVLSQNARSRVCVCVLLARSAYRHSKYVGLSVSHLAPNSWFVICRWGYRTRNRKTIQATQKWLKNDFSGPRGSDSKMTQDLTLSQRKVIFGVLFESLFLDPEQSFLSHRKCHFWVRDLWPTAFHNSWSLSCLLHAYCKRYGNRRGALPQSTLRGSAFGPLVGSAPIESAPSEGCFGLFYGSRSANNHSSVHSLGHSQPGAQKYFPELRWDPTWLHTHTHTSMIWQLISKLRRTSVTQGFLAGIVLCTSA